MEFLWKLDNKGKLLNIRKRKYTQEGFGITLLI